MAGIYARELIRGIGNWCAGRCGWRLRAGMAGKEDEKMMLVKKHVG